VQGRSPRLALLIQKKGNEMSLKLKILGLGLLAAIGTSAFAVVNASALSTGHFTSHLPAGHDQHLIIKGTESRKAGQGNHALEFNEINTNTETTGGTGIICTHVDYHGTLEGAAATTTTSVKVRPNYTECSTKGSSEHNVIVDVPAGCGTNVFDFTPGGNGTVHVNCAITITHPACRIVIPTQTLSGITYTPVVEGKSALTLDVAVHNITGHYESGFCVFVGTNHLFEMTGTVTVWGEDTPGNRVGITHTG
jgi:hypothetical protein